MKILFIILLLVAPILSKRTPTLSVNATADYVVGWTVGEYNSGGICASGKVIGAQLVGGVLKQDYIPGLTHIDYNASKSGGCQYGSAYIDSVNKNVYYQSRDGGDVSSVTTYALDNSGNPINAKLVYGFWHSFIVVKDDAIGSMFYHCMFSGVSYQIDPLQLNGGNQTSAPIAMTMPALNTGEKIIQVTGGANTPPFSSSVTNVYALTNQSRIFRWQRGSATTPTLVSYAGGSAGALQIECLGQYALVIRTSTTIISNGIFDSRYTGMASHSTTSTDLKTIWEAAGCMMPVDTIVGTSNTLRVLKNGRLFVSGSNIQGEFGNGDEFHNWAAKNPYPWLWQLTNGEMLAGPVEIKTGGRITQMCGGSTLGFVHYSKDQFNQWWNVYRNKSKVGNNGVTLPAFGAVGYDNYPNLLDVCGFQKVPSTWPYNWTVLSFSTAYLTDPHPPVANAGIDQLLATGVTSTTLQGEGSSQQEFTIVGHQWRKVSGPSCTIISTSSQSTSVNALQPGSTYVFGLVETNDQGTSSTESLTTVVTAAASDPYNSNYFFSPGRF